MRLSTGALRSTVLLVLSALVLLLGGPGFAAGESAARPASGPSSVQLPPAGKKVWVGEDFYFIHEFDKRPAMGPLVLKIQLFTKDGTRSTALVFKGSSDMPSMRGAHYTGDQPFRISKKGDYLLPIDVVMPGDWEVQVLVLSGETVLFRGHILFDV